MSTPPLASDPDNDGLTQYYSIRYPLPNERVRNAQVQLEAMAVTTDTALHQAVQDAAAAAQAASQPYVQPTQDAAAAAAASAAQAEGASFGAAFMFLGA